MNTFYQKNKIELGIDEAGRGCLIDVCIAIIQ